MATQIDTTLYGQLAENYAAAKEGMVGVAVYLGPVSGALKDVIDITTSTHSDNAADLELALLGPTNTAFDVLNQNMESTTAMNVGIRALNDYVVLNTTAATKILADNRGLDYLTYFVNIVMKGSWTDPTNCIPYYWCVLCESTGYDTSDWDCCSIS